MGLSTYLINGLNNNNLKFCNIVINGSYFMSKGKLICCEVSKRDSSTLNFYVTKSDVNGDIRDFIPGAFNTLKDRVYSTTLFDMELPIVVNNDEFKFAMIPELHLAIIKSKVYEYAEFIANKQREAERNGDSLNLHGFNLESTRDISPQYLGEFMSNFWSASRLQYRDLVYRGASNRKSRFIQQLLKQNEFYKIMNAFVPVFVDCSLFFNPQDTAAIRQTTLYEAAVEKDRVIAIETDSYQLSAYFLTQEEICKAFHMHHFMRFNPQFCYDIFMGLLYPNDAADFPTIQKKVFIGPPGVTAYGLKRTMTASEFDKQLSKLKLAKAMTLSSVINLDGHQVSSDEFEKILSSYHDKDSLWVECELFYETILRSGAYVLDGKRPSVETLYMYLQEAQL